MKDPPSLSPPLRATLGNSHRGAAVAPGFTLLELLFYAATSGLVLTAITIAILVSMRSNARFELHQREEARLNRITSLIQSEANEAQTVASTYPATAITDCTGLNSGSFRFALTIPNPYSTPIAETVKVYYYQIGSGIAAELRRCGPPYNNDGSLDFSADPSTATVALSTELTVNAASESSEKISYTLTFWRPSNLIDASDVTQESQTSPLVTASVGVK